MVTTSTVWHPSGCALVQRPGTTILCVHGTIRDLSSFPLPCGGINPREPSGTTDFVEQGLPASQGGCISTSIRFHGKLRRAWSEHKGCARSMTAPIPLFIVQ